MSDSWKLYKLARSLQDAVPATANGVSCEALRRHIQKTEMCDIEVREHDTMDVELVRGIYTRSGTGVGSKIVIHHGKLNKCWTRFVRLKEMMHIIMDSHADYSRSGADLLSDILVGSKFEPAATASEIVAIAAAISYALPPSRARELTTVSAYDVAKAYSVPELYVSKFYALLAPDFNEFDDQFAKRNP